MRGPVTLARMHVRDVDVNTLLLKWNKYLGFMKSF